MIRILVAHPSSLVCSLYASVIDEKPSMEVVAQATSLQEALQQVESGRCNIVLASAMLGHNGALKLTKEIVENHPEVKVLVVGMPESKQVIVQYVMAGASGYVLEDVTVDGLFENIRAVQKDEAIVSPTMAAVLMERVADLAAVSAQHTLEPGAYADLTPRELEILELVGQGLTNQEIATQLYIEVGTVKNHVHNILSKLDVASREDAAAHLPFIQEEDDDTP